MLIHAIDFAATAWAQCLLRGGEVVFQDSAWNHPSERAAVRAITAPHLSRLPQPDVMLIEDVPHQMRFDTITKSVCRMQGRVIDRMDQLDEAGKILFVPPALWQRGFFGLGFADGKELWKSTPARYAEFAFHHFGYEPPNLLEIHKELLPATGKPRQDMRNRLKKLMTDYVDAFLIAKWYELWVEQHGPDEDPKSSQRYLR